MAKRFTETVQLQPIDTSTGAAQGALSLADQLEGFKTQMTELAAEKAAERGEASAAKVRLEEKDGITQAPAMKKASFFGGIEKAAHNKALKGAYLASLSNDITESVNEIENANPASLLKFNDSANGLAKGVLSGVDPSARQQVATFLDSKIIAARDRVQVKNIAADRALSMGQMQLASDTAADESQSLARAGDLLGSAERLNEYNLINAGMVEAGFMTPAEEVTKRRDAEFNATKEVLIGGVNDQIQAGDFNGAIGTIQKLRDKIPGGFTTEEHDEVVGGMISELNESIALNNKLEDDSVAVQKAKQDDNYVGLFVGVADGTKNAQDIIKATRKRTISAEQSSKLLNTLNSRGMGADDWGMVTILQADIRNGKDISNDVLLNAGTNLTESTALDLLAMQQEAKKGGASFTSDPNYKEAESFINRKMKVTGPFGALDTDAERRLADAERALFFRTRSGENPWDIADELISLDDVNRAPNPMFGTKETLDVSEEQLNTAFDTKQIDDVTYNFEMRKIKQLRELTALATEFIKAKKGAADAAKR